MILRQEDNFFSLKIIGYEFLNSNVPEDLNWLNIEISVKDSFYDWKSKGAFLETNELVDLLNWFDNVFSSNFENDNRIDFLENELSFEFYNKERYISVNLDFNFHPKKEKYQYGKDKEYKILFDLESLNGNDINSNLNSLILKFPNRSER